MQAGSLGKARFDFALESAPIILNAEVDTSTHTIVARVCERERVVVIAGCAVRFHHRHQTVAVRTAFGFVALACRCALDLVAEIDSFANATSVARIFVRTFVAIAAAAAHVCGSKVLAHSISATHEELARLVRRLIALHVVFNTQVYAGAHPVLTHVMVGPCIVVVTLCEISQWHRVGTHAKRADWIHKTNWGGAAIDPFTENVAFRNKFNVLDAGALLVNAHLDVQRILNGRLACVLDNAVVQVLHFVSLLSSDTDGKSVACGQLHPEATLEFPRLVHVNLFAVCSSKDGVTDVAVPRVFAAGAKADNNVRCCTGW
jgi:hypothetical protein